MLLNALKTSLTYVSFLKEEANESSLDNIVEYIAGVIARAERANLDQLLFLKGLLEFIPAIKNLISELNDFLAHNQEEFDLVRRSAKREYIISKLSPVNSEIYAIARHGCPTAHT